MSFSKRSTPLVIVSALSAAALVSAIVEPNLPYGGVVDRTGATCNIGWAVDATNTWNSMDIELMTGDNFNFVHLAWVARNVDGTASPGSYSWDCPEVTINAPIYFYQFTQTGQPATYTTRFTIAAADGTTVPAPNPTQPDGQAIGWGTGAIVGGSPDTGSSSGSSSSGTAGSSSGTTGSSSGSSSSASSGTSGGAVVSGSSASSSGSSASSASAANSPSSDSSAPGTTVVTVQPSSTTRRLTSADTALTTTGASNAASGSRNTTAAASDTGAAGRGSKVAGAGLALVAFCAAIALA